MKGVMWYPIKKQKFISEPHYLGIFPVSLYKVITEHHIQ